MSGPCVVLVINILSLFSYTLIYINVSVVHCLSLFLHFQQHQHNSVILPQYGWWTEQLLMDYREAKVVALLLHLTLIWHILHECMFTTI